jgi:hypothetical protein
MNMRGLLWADSRPFTAFGLLIGGLIADDKLQATLSVSASTFPSSAILICRNGQPGGYPKPMSRSAASAAGVEQMALEWSDMEEILAVCRAGTLSGAVRKLG